MHVRFQIRSISPKSYKILIVPKFLLKLFLVENAPLANNKLIRSTRVQIELLQEWRAFQFSFNTLKSPGLG